MKFLTQILLIAVLAMTACMPPAAADNAEAPKTQVTSKEEEDAVNALAKLGVPMHRDPSGVVRWIEAKKGELTDEAMALLPALSKLEWLEISGGKVTATGVAHLKGCPEMKRLYIYDINLAGDKLQWLEALTRLEALSLQRTGVDASVMESIKSSNLSVLNLSGNPIGDELLDAVARIRELEVLALADTRVTGPGLEKLRGMHWLNQLNLMRCNIQDRDIEVFLSMPNLRIVYAEGSPLTNFGIQNIVSRFPTLAIFL